MTEKSHIALY